MKQSEAQKNQIKVFHLEQEHMEEGITGRKNRALKELYVFPWQRIINP